ncbi:MAG TPA: hypothetical protein VF103_02955 [Polyangiaceae bacterium]
MTSGARAAGTAFALITLVTGCYTPGYNTYSTVRTTPPRGVSAAFHFQVTGHSGEVGGEREPYIAPFPPGVSGRYGLAERLDAGLRLGISVPDAYSVGGDVKWLVLPGEALDLARDPGLLFSSVNHLGIDEPAIDEPSPEQEHDFWQLRAPILTGLNLSRAVVVVLTTGFVYGWPSPEFLPPQGDRTRFVDGFAPLVGLGINFRADESIAFHPEATLVFSTDDGERRTIYTFGFALQFGRLPRTIRTAEPQQPAKQPRRAE